MVPLYLTMNNAEPSEVNSGSTRFKLMPGVVKYPNIILKRPNYLFLEDQALKFSYELNSNQYEEILLNLNKKTKLLYMVSQWVCVQYIASLLRLNGVWGMSMIAYR